MNEEVLARVDLFSTLDKREQQVLARSCQERSYKAGTALFAQGDTGVGLYVLKQGQVRIMQARHPDRAEEELFQNPQTDRTNEDIPNQPAPALDTSSFYPSKLKRSSDYVLGIMGPGDVLGEMALLDDLPRSATAIALEDVTALLLPVWEFRGVLRDHPEMALKLLGVMSRRLRRAEAREQD